MKTPPITTENNQPPVCPLCASLGGVCVSPEWIAVGLAFLGVLMYIAALIVASPILLAILLTILEKR